MSGWLGVAARRASHDAASGIAAAALVLVTAGVLVTAAIYPGVVVRTGIARTLAAAPPVATGVSVAVDVLPTDVANDDRAVRGLIAGALGPTVDEIALTGLSESYALSGEGAAQPPATRFGFADGLDAHAHLLRGRWATDVTGGDPTELEAVVNEPAATLFHADAGTVLTVASNLDLNRRFAVHIVGVFAVNDPADAFWGGGSLLAGGSEQLGPFTTVGPLFVGRQTFLERTIVTRASLAWRATPVFAAFAPEDLGQIGGNVGALHDRVAGGIGGGQTIVVVSDLPRLLAAVSNGVGQAMSGSTVVAAQIVMLAMYALIFVATLVVGQRRATTSLFRARGAASRHLFGLALIEAFLIAIPASVLGLPLGLGLAALLANTGLGAAPASSAIPSAPVLLSAPSVGLTGLAGLVAIVGLVLPTVVGGGALANDHRSPGRVRAAALLQRSRLDLAIVAIGVVALWQLRSSAGIDLTGTSSPIAVAGPGIGLLAGAILLLRLVPAIGRALERTLVRPGSAGGALIVRGVARRSAAYGRPALLFAMSAALGLFAVGYGRTWEGSQRDQAAQAVGADIRGEVGTGAKPSVDSAAAAYRAIPGVAAATPVVHEDFATGSALPHGMLLAVVPEAMRTVAAARSDLGDRPFSDLLGGLIAARPDLPGLTLPAGVRRLRIQPDLRLSPLTPDGALPPGWSGLSVAVVKRDSDGRIERIASAPELGTPQDAFIVRFERAADPVAPAAAIIAIELRLALPGNEALTGSVGIASLESSLTADGDDWMPLDPGDVLRGWASVRTISGASPTSLPSGPAAVEGDLYAATFGSSPGDALAGPSNTTVVVRPKVLSDLVDAPLAGLVGPALLAATGSAVGDVALVRHASTVTRRILATHVVTTFPTLPDDGFAVVDLGTFQVSQYAADLTIPDPDEWWFSIVPGADRSVLAALATGPTALETPRSRALETATRLDDPIALTVSGMLVLAATSAAVFALIGFASAARATTESRLAEYSIARALGFTRRQIAAWLLLEQAYPLIIGVGWGIGLGVALEWLVLPAVTLGPDGALARPMALVAIPLDLVLVYAVLVVLLAPTTALLLSRTVRRAGMTDPLRGGS